MRFIKAKIFIFAFLLLFIFFFSNDFGLIDIEKTAIITALALDTDESGEYEYEITAQIAVPEARQINTENQKAQVSGKGNTVGSALKNIGDVSGWFPKLAFCNIIIIGNGLDGTNVIKVLDYFSKTLRVQDSALVIKSEKTAKEILEKTTPLDNISAFALQKILFKNPGFDMDIAEVDVKTFCSGYYSPCGSSFMPIIKIVEEESSSGGSGGNGGNGSNGGGQSSGEQQKEKPVVFDATTTALYKNGYLVGTLNKEETFARNSLYEDFYNTTFEVNNVVEDGEERNYLLTIKRCVPKIEISASDTAVKLSVSLDLYCKISDLNSSSSDATYEKNQTLPVSVKLAAEQKFGKSLNALIKSSINTGCDFFSIKESLYRYHNKYYKKYKETYLNKLQYSVKVNVTGQK